MEIGMANKMGGNYVCHLVGQINSRGVWYGDDPLEYSLPLIILQVSLISILTRIFYLLLKPLGQPLIVSQILGGVILGPSVLGLNTTFASKLFPINGRIVLDTFSVFGFTLYIFLVGVKINPAMVLKPGKRVLSIGIMSFITPHLIAGALCLLLYCFVSLDEDLPGMFTIIIGIQSMSAFPVITSFLTELNILNSEIGRLVTSSSIVCDICHWSLMLLSFGAHIAAMRSLRSLMASILSACFLILLIVFGIRSVAMWTIKHTPEGKPIKDIYVFLILIGLLCCGFMGEAIGMSSLFPAFLMGLVIPDGPPLAVALVEWLDCFVSVMLMPTFFAMCGSSLNIFAIQNTKKVVVIQSIVFSVFVGKAIGAILPPLFYRMPLRDAFSLALIMNSKGIVELAILSDLKRHNIMNEEYFAIMIVSLLMVTGIVSPLVKILYDPSRGYLAYRRRTIFHNKGNEELRFLACIHSQDNVQAVMNLLEASSPTKESPINLMVLHLVKLVGRASSSLIACHQHENISMNTNQSERIFNAFRKFQQRNSGTVSVNCFQAISPHTTMHNDVCSIALDKRTTFTIIPFHKQWSFGEWVHSPNTFRHLNRNVLDNAPCSVGILIDRGTYKRAKSVISEPSVYRVVMLFFGGADDREALAYGTRMSLCTDVMLTLIRFSTGSSEIVDGTERSKMLDMQILSDLRYKCGQNERIFYRDEIVGDAKGVIEVTSLLGSVYDLIMVGRRHGASRIMSKLRKYSNCEELGAIGETLVSSNLKPGASVLVVQQQTRVWGLHDTQESTHLRKVKL